MVSLLIQNYQFSKWKDGKESCFADNKIKEGQFFSFTSCNSLHKKLEHSSQWPSAYNAWNVLLIWYICERFLQWSSGYLLQKYAIFMGKKFPFISQGIKKKPSLLIDLSTFSKIVPLCIFFKLWELCTQSQIMSFCMHT